MLPIQKVTTRLYPTTIRLAKMQSKAKGGTLRDAGVTFGGGILQAESTTPFGKIEAAKEEEYFFKMQREQLKALKSDTIKQTEFHRKTIADLEKAILRHKEYLEHHKTF